MCSYQSLCGARCNFNSQVPQLPVASGLGNLTTISDRYDFESENLVVVVSSARAVVLTFIAAIAGPVPGAWKF